MARSGLRWTTDDLAHAAGVSRISVARLERGDKMDQRTIDVLVAAMEKAGAQFIRRAGQIGVTIPE